MHESIVFVVRVRCRRTASSLSYLLMSFFWMTWLLYCAGATTAINSPFSKDLRPKNSLLIRWINWKSSFLHIDVFGAAGVEARLMLWGCAVSTRKWHCLVLSTLGPPNTIVGHHFSITWLLVQNRASTARDASLICDINTSVAVATWGGGTEGGLA